MLRKLFIFILCLTPWLINNILPINYNYLSTINLPSFTPNIQTLIIIWTLVYIIISLNISNIFISYKFKEIPLNYKLTLILNYLLNESFLISLLILNNTQLSLIFIITVLTSTIILYKQSSLIQSKQAKLLWPYIIFNIYQTLLLLIINMLN